MDDEIKQSTLEDLSWAELVEELRAERLDEDSEWPALPELHHRGGAAELELTLQLTHSDNPEDRTIGADILGQFGVRSTTKEERENAGPEGILNRGTFLKETVDELLRILDDDAPSVLSSAAVGLGYRGDPRAVEPLSKLADHPDAEVRHGVVFGLLGYEDPLAIESLIKLSRDEDEDVRDWATFGLGSQIEVDTPEIRQALADRLEDSFIDAKEEAIAGLAKRSDKRATDPLLEFWEQGLVSVATYEAAAALADPMLLPELREQKEESEDWTADLEYLRVFLDDALKACGGKD